METFGWLCGGIAAIFSGFMMFAVVVQESESIAQAAFGVVCGLILLAGGVGMLMIGGAGEALRLKTLLSNLGFGIFKSKAPSEIKDDTPVERLMTSFRKHYGSFLQRTSGKENLPLQYDVTQTFWSMAHFQKQRMERLGVEMELISQRKEYADIESTRQKTIFDGRSYITNAQELVSTKRIYRRNGQPIHTRKNTYVAHYTMQKAKNDDKSKRKIICPQCGNPSDRENLIDGCDYCGTKFTIEDLGLKVANFATRGNYEINYARYKEARRFFADWAFLVVFLLTVIVAMGFYTIGFISGEMEFDITLLLAAPLGAMFAGGCFGILARYAFLFIVFPVIQLFASALYWGKKSLDKSRQAQEMDKKMEQFVQQFDNMFSISVFYANIQNKLAAVLYADSQQAINVFSDVELKELLPVYRDVIDTEIEDIRLIDFGVSSGLQYAVVEAEVKLLKLNGNTIKSDREHLQLRLVKEANCKTQAVCGPAVLLCKGCGASLFLVKGKTCEYCGRDLDWKQVDWAIQELRR